MSVSSTQYCRYVEWVLARNRLRADQETGMFGDTICQDDQLAHMSYILRRVGIPAYRTVCRLSVPPYSPHPSMFITGLVVGEEVFGLYGERSWAALASVEGDKEVDDPSMWRGFYPGTSQGKFFNPLPLGLRTGRVEFLS